MGEFKIIKGPVNVRHIRAKCSKSNREFLIRLEQEGKAWYMVFASEADSASGRESRTAETETEGNFEGGLFAGADYACPYCGNDGIVRCGKCGRITCNDNGKRFQCAYCGNSGVISGSITSAYVENSASRKKGKKK